MAESSFAGIDEVAWLRAEVKRLALLLATDRPVVHQPDLRAPFPYFGNKRRAAPLVWSALGDVSNLVIGLHQLLGLAGHIVDELFGEPRARAAAPAERQLGLDLAAPASPPTRPAKPRVRPPAAPEPNPALAAHRAPHGPAQAALPFGVPPA